MDMPKGPEPIFHRLLLLIVTTALVVGCAAPAGSASPPPSGPAAPPTVDPTGPSAAASGSEPPTTRVEPVGSMVRARTGFNSIVLGDGTVLAVGDDFACFPGPAQPGSERAERFDPATDAWTAAESLNKPRQSFAMVRLADGRALVIGGTNADEAMFSSTKLFDPTNGSWSDGPLLDVERADPAAATIADGRVVVVSPTSFGETASTSTTEILDPAATAWSNSGPARDLGIFTLVPLADGRLLGLGFGFESDTLVTLFDPDTGMWQQIDGPAVVRQARVMPLADGDALAFGFQDLAVGRMPTTRVERFDAGSASWSEVAPMSTRREGAMLVRLADGRLLVAGGAAPAPDGEAFAALATTEVYDPAADTWTAGPDLLEPRRDGHARLLTDGSVLIFGGDADFNVDGEVPWCPAPMATTERIYLGS